MSNTTTTPAKAKATPAKATPAKAKATPAKAKAEATPAKATPALRVEHAALVGTAKAAVGTVARQAKRDGHGEGVALALRALLRQSYRPTGAVVAWAQPSHRTSHGEATPDNGAPQTALVAHVVATIGALPAAAKGEATDRKTALAALAALATVLPKA